MKKISFIFIVIGVTLFAACSQKNSASKTPKVIPTTYTTDVIPLIQAKCSPCHLPSKGGRKASFENYEGAKKYSADILARIQLNPTDRGFMPFKNAKLSAEEIVIVKKWVDQGLLEK
ncbi:MAG: c-type cytochrome [Ferruginibacter sp.]